VSDLKVGGGVVGRMGGGGGGGLNFGPFRSSILGVDEG